MPEWLNNLFGMQDMWQMPWLGQQSSQPPTQPSGNPYGATSSTGYGTGQGVSGVQTGGEGGQEFSQQDYTSTHLHGDIFAEGDPYGLYGTPEGDLLNHPDYTPTQDEFTFGGPSEIENSGQFDYGFTGGENIGLLPTSVQEAYSFIKATIPNITDDQAMTIAQQIDLYDYAGEKELVEGYERDIRSQDIDLTSSSTELSQNYLQKTAYQTSQAARNIFARSQGLSGKEMYDIMSAGERAKSLHSEQRESLQKTDVISREDLYTSLVGDVREERQDYNLLQQILDAGITLGYISEEDKEWADSYVSSLIDGELDLEPYEGMYGGQTAIDVGIYNPGTGRHSVGGGS